MALTKYTYMWARTYRSIENGKFSKVHLVTYRDDDYAAACNTNTILSAIPVDRTNVERNEICSKCWNINYGRYSDI
jgi:hypothetical protein